MRTLVPLFFIGLLVFGAIYYFTMQASEDPGYQFAVAFGAPEGDTITMHTVIYNRTVRIDPPRIDPNTQSFKWQEWVDSHFDLQDEKGAKIPLIREGGSAFITGSDLGAGTPEFYLGGKLKKGAKYNFDYLPSPADGARYRFSFTAPAEVQKLKRPLFKEVTAGSK